MNIEKSNIFNNKSKEPYKGIDVAKKNFDKVMVELCNYNNVGGAKYIDRTTDISSNFINVNNILKEYFGEDFISKCLKNTFIYIINEPQELYIDYKLDNGDIVNMLYFSYNEGAIYVNDNYHISKKYRNRNIRNCKLDLWIFEGYKLSSCTE